MIIDQMLAQLDLVSADHCAKVARLLLVRLDVLRGGRRGQLGHNIGQARARGILLVRLFLDGLVV